MQRRNPMSATRDNERQLQGGGQRGQYRRDYDDEAMQRDFSAYDQEDDYGMQPSRGRGEWRADWSESGRSRGDEFRDERYGSGRDTRDSGDSRYGVGRQSEGQGYSRDAYGRDYGRDYDRDYGSGVSQGGAQQQRYGTGEPGQGRWQGRQDAGQRGYGDYGGYGPYGGNSGGPSMDMRHRQGPKGYSRTDERIREDVCERLCMAHQLEVQEVSVQVKDGHVELQGHVPQRWMKHVIEDVAEQCFGVQDVENRIRTQSSGSQGDHPHGGTGSGTSASHRSPGQSGTVGTAGSSTASSAAGSTGSSSGTSGTSNESGKHH
ncbi:MULTISPECIES: BON domain-containing protein [Pandoraea]|uniref:BON domain-containing protein n=1 Tax=Pandoraea TaxID=93217 RepID=UPI001F5CB43A|nr:MULTISPECIES: BON domain-containing protein [Pandoraea]MCI3207849.1 hypothetical protein [Pandoraea sp. LA3]MDN4585878.1 hypothetical protein [Pandoraea capi]